MSCGSIDAEPPELLPEPGPDALDDVVDPVVPDEVCPLAGVTPAADKMEITSK